MYLAFATLVASRSRGTGSPPAEQPLDIPELQRDPGRPAVIAFAGVGGRFHFAQERVHLRRLQAAAGAHGAVAGLGRGDALELVPERRRLVPFRELLGEGADGGDGVE